MAVTEVPASISARNYDKFRDRAKPGGTLPTGCHLEVRFKPGRTHGVDITKITIGCHGGCTGGATQTCAVAKTPLGKTRTILRCACDEEEDCGLAVTVTPGVGGVVEIETADCTGDCGGGNCTLLHIIDGKTNEIVYYCDCIA
jgi:hypothetical protein